LKRPYTTTSPSQTPSKKSKGKEPLPQTPDRAGQQPDDEGPSTPPCNRNIEAHESPCPTRIEVSDDGESASASSSGIAKSSNWGGDLLTVVPATSRIGGYTDDVMIIGRKVIPMSPELRAFLKAAGDAIRALE
jgi:hypothetical protein